TWDFGAIGILAKGGGKADISDTKVTTNGDYAYGIQAETENNKGGILTADGVNVHTSGANAHGAVARGNNSNLTVKNSHITTSGKDASGIHAVNGSTVTLDNTYVKSSGASISSQLTENVDQTININKNNDLRDNNGTFLQVNRVGDGLDGNINLTIGDGTVAHGDIHDSSASGQGKTNLTLS